MGRKVALPCALMVLAGAALSASAQGVRIRGVIDGNRVVMLQGHVPREVRTAADLGVLDPGTAVNDVRLMLQPSAEQMSALEQLLEEQHDPASGNYQRWLTPEEYGERFGLGEDDLAKLTAWLESEGLTVRDVAHARNWITVGGTAGQLSRIFHTKLHRFDAAGEAHFGNVIPPAIPRALEGIVAGVLGLDDFRPQPQVRARVHPQFNGSSGAHYLAPDDLATIYNLKALYAAGFDGGGQKIVIAGQTNIKVSDIRAFRAQFNLPASDPQMVLTGSDPGIRPADAVEADLDIEWAGAAARSASIVYVYSPNVFQSIQYAIDRNLAPVISLSYGACEIGIPTSYRTMAQQANAQGITWLSASGDSAAAGCDPQGAKSATQGPAIIFPANLPEVTAVGGTEFNEGSGSYWAAQNGPNLGSALSYISEKAWNDTSSGYGIEGTGGGASTVYPKPWWQTGPGVPDDKARDIPDVSLSASGAHDGYVMYANGGLMSVGGTSASTPSFAGIVSLLNQYLVAKGLQSQAGLGNINPALYQLAQSKTGVFHDITVGDNIVPCTTGSTGCSTGSFGYKTGPGYDLVTGLGSVDAYNLVVAWAGTPASVGTTMTLAAAPASVAATGTVQLTATVKAVTGTASPAGSVSFSFGNSTLGTAALVAAASGAQATAILTINGSALATGNNTIAANYTAQSGFAASTGSIVVAVTASSPVATSTTLAANPSSIASTGTTQVTATVKAASGTTTPSGAVRFSFGSASVTTVPLVNGVAAMTVSGSGLSAGSNTVTASYAGTSNFSSSTATTSITVTAPVTTTTTVAATVASIAPTGSTQVTATVKAASGSTVPGGSIAFSAGDLALGSATLSGGMASITVKGTSLRAGSNTITATYLPSGNFAASFGTVTITVTGIATITTVTANPLTIAVTASTVLNVTVKAATGTAVPGGSIVLSAGSVSLGSASLVNGSASVTVKGSSLATGMNVITASYSTNAGFLNSSGTVNVTVTGPAPVATTTTLTASPASIAASGTSILTATVKASAVTSGGPPGSVTFAIGKTTLGSSVLVNGIATLTLKGSSLPAGANVVIAIYSGASGFATSSGTATVTVASSTPAKVIATATSKGISTQFKGWLVALLLQEQAGTAASLTGFTINGIDYSSLITPAFGSSRLEANGALSANLVIQWSPLPATVTFGFTGVDAAGNKWAQTVAVATK